ncbi:WD40 repeat-like protein [Delitschia confertaspora ATCC 74209]|uniref:Pre-rRNA-processing protein IPI3 n=1 Tax=Delitschia confertaspora ATCC 74209 TaxID=1513339 RepID=A0A9P4JMX4_9PLEO|nr:WD40 repeat-like protein [Delitschia confertaspora ATCC 74209]
MLTETFVASISAHTKPNTGITKDAGIFVHESQPLAAQRHVFKKSASASNGLAVSSSHIFAAQDGKAVVHVYSREKGNMEVVVPFQERVHSVALAAGETVLLLGMESGRVLCWEIASGRLVSTSTSHLSPVTKLAVDPDSNFFLSGSSDAMIHVWSLLAVLSFSPDTSRSPIRTLSTHRGPITSLICGHSSTAANVAISISQDKSAIVWDYRNGVALRTYLLPDVPTTLSLDPADRAFYVAYEDGSLQTISFFDDIQQSAPTDTLRDPALSHRPVQPPTGSRFNAASQNLGSVISSSLSWDGTTLVSGHTSGKVASWDLAKRTYITTLATLPGPVTNLQFLPPTGFPNVKTPSFKIQTVVKPRHDLATGNEGAGMVPQNYGLNMQFTSHLSVPSISAAESSGRGGKSEFKHALTHPSFPTDMLEESILELQTWGQGPQNGVSASSDFLSFSTTEDKKSGTASNEELTELKRKYEALQRVQKVMSNELYELQKDNEWYKKHSATQKNNAKKTGDADGDVEMGEDESGSEAGSTEESDSEEEEEVGGDSSSEDEDEEASASENA